MQLGLCLVNFTMICKPQSKMLFFVSQKHSSLTSPCPFICCRQVMIDWRIVLALTEQPYQVTGMAICCRCLNVPQAPSILMTFFQPIQPGTAAHIDCLLMAELV